MRGRRTWRAARFGTEENLVDVGTAQAIPAWNVIDRLIDSISRSLQQTGDTDLVRSGLDRIRRRGTGARLQRNAFVNGGSIDDVIDAIAEQTIA